MYRLCFHVPQSHVEAVKEAIFDAGAGVMGSYSHCSWQILGEGQFKPLEGSNAFIGMVNQIETIAEYRVETICAEECLHAVVEALKQAHPYEVPSYQAWKLEEV